MAESFTLFFVDFLADQRSRIAREVLDTEKKYCSSLWTIIDHFAVPLKQANILSTKEVATMFPQCLWRIYGHHCLFLQKLENRLANWKWQCVLGDIFAQFVDDAQVNAQCQTVQNPLQPSEAALFCQWLC